MDPIFENAAAALVARAPMLAPVKGSFLAALEAIWGSYCAGGELLLAGNGGSAADADHICGELLKGFKSRRPLSAEEKAAFQAVSGAEGVAIAEKLQEGLPALSLLSHPGLCSAFANDVDPDLIYAQQLWAQGKKGDVFLGISTGGGAKNIRAAFQTARAKGIVTILLTGNKHGSCEEFADVVIAVPESETYLIQEEHIKIYHTLCIALEQAAFGKGV